MRNLYLAALMSALPSLSSAANSLTITVVNELPLARTSETVELSAQDLSPLGADLMKIHITDANGFTSFDAWKTHVDEFARRSQSPLKISVTVKQ